MHWKIVNSGSNDPQINMERDRLFLDSLDRQPILHFYEWKGLCATYGHFIQPTHFFHLDRVKNQRLQLAKRPTGGGILFHKGDLTFSVLLPSHHPAFSLNTLNNYAFVNLAVARSLERLLGMSSHLLEKPLEPSTLLQGHFCMAHPTQFDLIFSGRKIGGAAQRRTKRGFLHQGSLSIVCPPEELMKDVLQDGEAIVAAMRRNSTSVLEGDYSTAQIEEVNHKLRLLLIEELCKN